MIEGRKILQISRRARNIDGRLSRTIVETDHHVTKFRRTLPRGPAANGGFREQDLLQFYAEPGGLRTVAAEDIII